MRMKRIKQYRYVLAAVVVLSALVAFRSWNPEKFRYDAVKWAEPSTGGANVIAGEGLSSQDDILFVILDEGCSIPDLAGVGILKAAPGDLLEGDNFRKIRRNKGPVVLCSGDMSVSARVWMVLSETGIRELYILKKDPA